MPQSIKGIMKNNEKEEKKPDILFVHIGKMVAEVMYQKHISKQDFADLVSTDQSNVYRILKKESIETNQLFRYSKVLKHNFFKDLAEEFERRFPDWQ